MLVAEDPVPAIISNWNEATADTTSVRASVHLIRYDDVSRSRAHAAGEFGYRSPGHGFWRLQNDTADRQTHRVTDAGLPHKTIPFDDAHFRWHADRFFDINDREKSFSECRIDSGTKSDFRFFTGELLRTVDWATPFLSGRPNKTVAEEWTYSVTHQTKSHMWILAIPKTESPCARILASCELYFQRDPVRLLATRSSSIAGTHQTVLIYSDVHLEPEAWPEPDLSQYSLVSSTVQQATAE